MQKYTLFKTQMKQYSILRLIFVLSKYLIKYGNIEVFYHEVHYHDSPLEVKGVELRTTSYNDYKLTIY